MAAQRLQKGDDYTKKLVRFTPETCALIQGRAEASHLSFNAALMEFIRTATPAEEWRALERKVRKSRRELATATP